MKAPDKYYVYLVTNQYRTVLYTGITNDLARRLGEHQNNAVFTGAGFTGAYQAFYLVYYEVFHDVTRAIAREKEIKKWRREKKDRLIATTNPNWLFLNSEVN